MNFETKIKLWGFSISLNSNFGVTKSNSKGIREIEFEIFEIEFLAQEFKIEIEISILGCACSQEKLESILIKSAASAASPEGIPSCDLDDPEDRPKLVRNHFPWQLG